MNTLKRKNKGFTLLEIIIVVIIVGVLASLALPRLFSTVEFSRTTEAWAAIGSIRSSLERCALVKGTSGDFTGCSPITALDLDNPGNVPGAHFGYAVGNTSANAYVITATRNSIDGGAATKKVVITEAGAGPVRSGTTAYSAIK